MKEKWMIAAKRAPFNEIAERFHIDPLTARLIRNRDVVGDEAIRAYLSCSLSDIPDESELSGVPEAAAFLKRSIEQGKKIRVIGDYDIDGTCATFILVRGFTMLGARTDYAIPERMKDGYGLNIRLIEEAFADGTDIIVTCDNGISAVSEIEYARRMGIHVVVTDHHELPRREGENGSECIVPPADFVIDPKKPDETYPFPEICGAVVAWKLVLKLFSLFGRDRGEAMAFLPYAAFATVGDVMDLKEENRILVKNGLKALESCEDPGMRALIRVCGLEGRPLSAYHIGFVLGPCINASGRLETAMKAMKLLLSGDDHEAASYAQELKDLNEERKELTQQGLEEAMHILEGHGETGDKVYVIFLPSCHESIAGIIAGKVRERSAHPVYILTKSTEKDMIKGSGRSIPAYSMYDGLVPCAGLLEKFGGHRMAAGVTLRAENLPSFRRRLNEECTLAEEDFTEKILIDAAMPLGYISEKLIGEMKLLEPFGKGNEKPFFAQKGLRLKSARILGKNRNVLKLRVQGEDGTAMDALYFGDIEKMQAYIADRFGRDELGRLMAGYDNGIRLSVVYYPQMNEYRGNVSPQIVITHYM